jgi:hypothetical protein
MAMNALKTVKVPLASVSSHRSLTQLVSSLMFAISALATPQRLESLTGYVSLSTEEHVIDSLN